MPKRKTIYPDEKISISSEEWPALRRGNEMGLQLGALYPNHGRISHERTGEEEVGLSSLNRFIDNFIQSHEPVYSEPSATNTATETSDANWFVPSSVPSSSSSTLFSPTVLSSSTSPNAFVGSVPPHFWGQAAIEQAELHQNLQYAASQASSYPAASFLSTNSQLIQAAATTANPSTHTVTASLHSATSSSSSPFSTVTVYLPRDNESLSPYQCLLRQQLEFFEASHEEASVVQGRNKPVSLYQVGLRCRHCARVCVVQRTAGSTYYPTRLDSIYQSGQNIAKHHFDAKGGCPSIPRDIQQIMSTLAHEVKGRKGKSSKGGGKVYWAETAREVGIVETSNGLEFWGRR